MSARRMHAPATEIDDEVIAAKAEAHRANIKRYAALLLMNLTSTEREFIQRRLREEQLALEALAHDLAKPTAMSFGRWGHQHNGGHASIPAP
jgi:hypothetical protein